MRKDVFEAMKEKEVVVFVAGKITRKLKGVIVALIRQQCSVVVCRLSYEKRKIKVKDVYNILIRSKSAKVLNDRKSESVILKM